MEHRQASCATLAGANPLISSVALVVDRELAPLLGSVEVGKTVLCPNDVEYDEENSAWCGDRDREAGTSMLSHFSLLGTVLRGSGSC